jgi:formamidopyrimidine-DNA glycosylase
MPELPEVQKYKQYIDETSLHQPIKEATIKNEKILENINKADIENHLRTNTITQTTRFGKYLFLSLKTDSWLVLHFGMTGNLKYFSNINEQPAHTRLLLSFVNNHYLAFDCQRLFGLVTVTSNINEYIKNKKLGPDALTIKKKEFMDNLSNRTGKIKTILLNQHIISGIGNIYADEILFQSRIHPETQINNLSKDHIQSVFSHISFVLQTAIEHDADISNYPQTFLLPHRRNDNLCPLNKNHKLSTVKISGRTTYYCPYHQLKP